jgi:hypothetical protein
MQQSQIYHAIIFSLLNINTKGFQETELLNSVEIHDQGSKGHFTGSAGAWDTPSIPSHRANSKRTSISPFCFAASLQPIFSYGPVKESKKYLFAPP